MGGAGLGCCGGGSRGSFSEEGAVSSPARSRLFLPLALARPPSSAQVRAGKVFRSRMVDVRLSNRKLWARAIGIVAEARREREKKNRRQREKQER